MSFLINFFDWLVNLFTHKSETPGPAVPPSIPEEVVVPEKKDVPPAPIELPDDYDFRCSDGTPVPEELYTNAALLASNLRVLSARLNRPLRIISAYRTQEYHKWVGGAPDSPHLSCQAVDIRVVDEGEAEEMLAAIVSLMEEGKMTAGKAWAGPSYVHYDICSP